MTEAEIIGYVLIFLALLALVAGFYKTKRIPSINPWVAIILASLLAFGGAISIGWIENPFAEVETPTASVIECPTFDITPSAGTISVLNSAKDGYTIPARANQTGHTLIQEDNSTAWANPTCTFQISPDPFLGADNDDLGTVYYEVYDAEIAVDTSTDSYKLFSKSGGNRQVVWTGSGTEYVEGSHTMGMTSTVNLTLTLTVIQDSMSRIENTFDPVSVYVKFYNGCGWSEQYKLDFVLVDLWT
jgi:hypothetical protein